jgi:hypothetical protein
MKLNLIIKAAVFACFAIALSSCKKDHVNEITGMGSVNLEFDHRVGSQVLQLGTGAYTNEYGDDYTVTTFKYYVSNVTFLKEDGSKVLVPESYLLINAADASTKIQELKNIPAGDYTGVTFTIGVDKDRNFAGAQTGALDPANGMFWSWNSGYIFLMFEGTSPESTQASNQLFYHVGGAEDPYNTIRTTTLTFPATLRVRSNSDPDVHLFVDIASLFKGKTQISFATISGFHGGEDAMVVADNYASGLFRVDHIHN